MILEVCTGVKLKLKPKPVPVTLRLDLNPNLNLDQPRSGPAQPGSAATSKSETISPNVDGQ